MIKILFKLVGIALIGFAVVSGLVVLGIVVVPNTVLVFGYKEVAATVIGIAFALV